MSAGGGRWRGCDPGTHRSSSGRPAAGTRSSSNHSATASGCPSSVTSRSVVLRKRAEASSTKDSSLATSTTLYECMCDWRRLSKRERGTVHGTTRHDQSSSCCCSKWQLVEDKARHHRRTLSSRGAAARSALRTCMPRPRPQLLRLLSPTPTRVPRAGRAGPRPRAADGRGDARRPTRRPKRRLWLWEGHA